MGESICVQLFDEGVPTYKGVPASKIGENIFVLGCDADYDPCDEHWQYLPGSKVFVELRELGDGKSYLVATEAFEGTAYIGDHGICGSRVLELLQEGDTAIIRLASGGYGRELDSKFSLVFNEVTSLEKSEQIEYELYGVSELVRPGYPRVFRVMVTDSLCTVEITAQNFSIIY